MSLGIYGDRETLFAALADLISIRCLQCGIRCKKGTVREYYQWIAELGIPGRAFRVPEVTFTTICPQCRQEINIEELHLEDSGAYFHIDCEKMRIQCKGNDEKYPVALDSTYLPVYSADRRIMIITFRAPPSCKISGHSYYQFKAKQYIKIKLDREPEKWYVEVI